TFRPQLRRASSVASASMHVSWSEDLLRMNAVDVEDVVLVGGAGLSNLVSILPFILYREAIEIHKHKGNINRKE
ncbi:hypothetical protein L9F63_013955, partial [Diploptera punctata]